MLGIDAVAACCRFGLARAGPGLLDSELEPDSSGKSHLVNTTCKSEFLEYLDNINVFKKSYIFCDFLFEKYIGFSNIKRLMAYI